MKLLLSRPLTLEDVMACTDSLLWMCPELNVMHIIDALLDNGPNLKTIYGQGETDILLKVVFYYATVLVMGTSLQANFGD